MRIVLIGLNHRTAPVEVRERVAFSAEQACRAAGELRSQRVLEEVVVLSTCNRSEVYGVTLEDAPEIFEALKRYLTRFHRISPADLDGCLYRHTETDAVRHLFRVATGLDSMLLGEAEILGQVREAYRLALEQRTTGPVLNRLFQNALEVGKRVRAETDLGTRPMSVAFAAVKLAEKIFGKLRDHAALILGAGEMGQQVAEYFRDRGIRRVVVANRSAERARDLASRLDGEAADWSSLPKLLEHPDIVVSSISGSDPVLTRAMAERAMAARANRVMFVIDLGVPRNVEASVGALYNVYLYDVDDLTEIVEQNRKARENEIPRAEAIVSEQVGRFEAWRFSTRAAVVLEELRKKLRGQREVFLAKRLSELPSEQRALVAQFADELLDWILREPEARIRNGRQAGRNLEQIEVLRELFGLDKENR